MKYYEVNFTLSPVNSDACDLLAAMAGEAGFETFEETDEGLRGYVQQQLFDRELLDAQIAEFPLPGIGISYTVGEAEDKDWNEQWEQEGFEPIELPLPSSQEGGEGKFVIHDGRHLPSQGLDDIFIEIDAHLAFGTGTHETTRMICATLLTLPLKGQRVLDCGSGTGILGIAAMKLGARECVAYDIDEWSVDNTRHNAVINQVEVTPLHGDAGILNKVAGTFDLVMANINRNILLQDMAQFRQKMAPGARLILSGFYTADIALLAERAAELGLAVTGTKEDGDWACLVLQPS
jgi:ribosomal protein L11 methyltransferase